MWDCGSKLDTHWCLNRFENLQRKLNIHIFYVSACFGAIAEFKFKFWSRFFFYPKVSENHCVWSQSLVRGDDDCDHTVMFWKFSSEKFMIWHRKCHLRHTFKLRPWKENIFRLLLVLVDSPASCRFSKLLIL